MTGRLHPVAHRRHCRCAGCVERGAGCSPRKLAGCTRSHWAFKVLRSQVLPSVMYAAAGLSSSRWKDRCSRTALLGPPLFLALPPPKSPMHARQRGQTTAARLGVDPAEPGKKYKLQIDDDLVTTRCAPCRTQLVRNPRSSR